MITSEDEKKLIEIGKRIYRVFPNMFGNIFFRFNLRPGRKGVNMNYGFDNSKILEEKETLINREEVK